ncbi:hypothetical protein MLD38_012605 [Melastoma candidum]|uniref:Uncharacterized protein n=1 Tax=Melastoma candidum TaxID=119954 RepID=A0ACB9R7Y6_9MYRT|nr:hypothetical protein MLD38_012605 [Melastoma candidum]
MGKRKRGSESEADGTGGRDSDQYEDSSSDVESGSDYVDEFGGDDEEGHHIGSVSDGEGRDSRRGHDEMEQLEKEYMDLRNKESDVLENLKRHKDEDLLKGHAVKNQKALWDRTLELRFLIQKAFTSSNQLPQDPLRTSFCKTDEKVDEAFKELLTSTKESLNSILELQKALLDNNPAISPTEEGGSAQPSKKYSKDLKELDNDCNDEWKQISEMHRRMATFRDKSVDKWYRKTQVTTGAAAMKNKLHAFNQNITEQVSSHMRDPSRMIKQMQQRRSTVCIFGSVPWHVETSEKEEPNVEGDPELLDDAEFYQQLLKEFFETFDSTSSEAAIYAVRRLQSKKRKIVDRRASKSRKIRYNVHEKLLNFMAPQPMELPPMAPKLFENLFGLKTLKKARYVV